MEDAPQSARPSDISAANRLANANSLSRTWRLCLKELRESLRDRRTLVTLIVMPLIVYTILGITFQRFLLNSVNQSTLTAIIGVNSEQEGLFIESLLQQRRLRLEQQYSESPADDLGQRPLADQFAIELAIVDNMDQAMASGSIDVGVLVAARSNPQTPANVRTIRCQVIRDPASTRARIATDWLLEKLRGINQQYLMDQIQRSGQQATLPAEIVLLDQTPEDTAASSLATLIPLILVLMTVTGAVYPAIDLTAGERERGTLESLVAAPIPRLGLLFAKYVAVMTVALLTATANVTAMMVTLYSSALTRQIFGTDGIPLSTFVIVLALMVLFASFFSAILLAVTSFARTFKEAQAYIVPLILLSLAPCLVCLAPGIEMSGVLSVAPLVNIVLLARDVFTSSVNWSFAPLVLISTAVYAAAAVSVAARVFGSDAILYGSQTGLKDLFLTRATDRRTPSLSGATMILALLFPLYVLLVNGLSMTASAPIATRLILSGLVTILLFAVLPMATVRALALDNKESFRFQRPGVLATLGAILLGISLWPLLHEIVVVTHLRDAALLESENFQLAEAFVAKLRELSPALILLTMAVIPAVCEELFFRGFLMSSFAHRLSPRQSILLSAVLFGLFHVLAKSALAIERMLPSTLMGLVLGWVCWKTRSVFPGMVLHALHNGLLTMIAYFQPQISEWGWDLLDESHLPWPILAASIAGVLIGATMIWRTPADRPPT